MKVFEIINKINQIDTAKRYICDWQDDRGEHLCAKDIEVMDTVIELLEDLKISLLHKDTK